MTRQRGFTLIEMAFVVAIIGLVVGGGVLAIGPILAQSKLNQTNAALDQIEASLVVFAIRNNRLPCPADGSVANTGVTYGQEGAQSNAGSYANSCNAAATQNSVVPWVTLGLDETYSLDGWGNRISYYPANPMIAGVAPLIDSSGLNCLNRIASTTAPAQGFRSTKCENQAAASMTAGTYGTYSVPTYPFDNYIAVYVAANPATVELTSANPSAVGNAVSTASSANFVGLYGQRAAYVLISHGPSGWYGWTRGATQLQPLSANYTIKKYNSGVVANMAGTAGTSSGFVQGNAISATSRANTDYFDDIVRWRSPAFIIQQCGAVSCGNP